MKNLIAFIFLIGVTYCEAQTKISPTDAFSVSGQIKNPSTFAVATLDTFKIKSLNDVNTVNHMGKVLSQIKNVKGVLLKDVLNHIELNSASPKDAFGYYLECVGSDGFKVVFSRDEVFNTVSGDNLYIITEKDGKKLKDIDDRIAILMIYEPGKGHVYLKGLKEIIFKSVNF